MIRFLKLILIINIVLLASCSFKNPAGLFEDRMKEIEKAITEKNTKIVFTERKKFTKEISGNIIKKIIEKPLIAEKWLQQNYTKSNFVPHLEYENKNQLVHKSKKIGKNKFGFSSFLFEPLILNDEIFFYDFSGTVYNYSIEEKKLKWKFNFYKKRYKNMPVIIKLKISENNLIVADNIGYVYYLGIDTGKLKWAKNYGIPFKSNIKADKENIFILNQDNKYYSVGEKDGSQILSLETFPSFLKAKHETQISLDSEKNNIHFITSNGELYSINYKTENLNWFSSIFVSANAKGSDFFYSSPIIYKNNKLFFSTSTFTYAVDSKNGSVKWELPFSTYLRPIVTENFIFLASKNGFFLNLDPETGKVLWSIDLFKSNQKLKKEKIGDIVSLLLVSNQLLASTSKGFFLFLDYKNGKIINYTKASRAGFFSNPVVVNKMIHVIDNKMRVLIFN